jgi:hypothetical protein
MQLLHEVHQVIFAHFDDTFLEPIVSSSSPRDLGSLLKGSAEFTKQGESVFKE